MPGRRAGDDAERRAEAEGERRGAAHQQQRVGQPLEDDVADRPGEGDRPAEIEAGERREVGASRASTDWSSAVAWRAAPRPARRRRRRSRRDRRRRRRRRRCFKQEEDADDDDQQHRDAADRGAGRGARRRCARHAATRREARHASYHASSPVSAQFDTAQRGLLATFLTMSRATVMKPHSATLISGRSSATSLLELACRAPRALRRVEGVGRLGDQRVELGVGVAALVGERHAVRDAALDEDGGRDRRVAAEDRRARRRGRRRGRCRRPSGGRRVVVDDLGVDADRGERLAQIVAELPASR